MTVEIIKVDRDALVQIAKTTSILWALQAHREDSRVPFPEQFWVKIEWDKKEDEIIIGYYAKVPTKDDVPFLTKSSDGGTHEILIA